MTTSKRTMWDLRSVPRPPAAPEVKPLPPKVESLPSDTTEPPEVKPPKVEQPLPELSSEGIINTIPRSMLVPLSVWFHLKTKSLYVVLGVADCSNAEEDEGQAVVYYNTVRRRLRYRDVNEFLDGRFVPINIVEDTGIQDTNESAVDQQSGDVPSPPEVKSPEVDSPEG